MKKFNLFKRNNLWFGLASAFLAIVVLVSALYVNALPWRGRVDELLGSSSSSVSRSQNIEDYKYVSDFEDSASLLENNRKLNERLQEEGSVLLKGTAADLKVGGDLGVTLFGMRSYSMQVGGEIGSYINAEVVSLDQALTQRGFNVNTSMVDFYATRSTTYAPGRADSGNMADSEVGARINEVPVSEYSGVTIGADYKDAAIVVLGRTASESANYYPGSSGIANPSEFQDSTTGNILGLSDGERDLVNWVKGQGFEKVIVLLNTVCAMEIEELKNDADIDSILWIGTPGAYGTYGIADLLKGDALPSGHLTDTFAVDSAKSAAAQNIGVYLFANEDEIDTSVAHNDRAAWFLLEMENIYTGYKYYETRYYDSIMNESSNASAVTSDGRDAVNGATSWNYDDEVSYSFGYGVEGSTFSEEITDVNIDWTGATDSTVTVKVTNTGTVAAKHTVQLYVSVPYTAGSGVEKSAIQLIGYGKTGEAEETANNAAIDAPVLLAGGATEDITITFNAQDMYAYADNYSHDGVTGAYVLDAGNYYFATGNGAHDAVQAVIKEQDSSKLSGVNPTGDVYEEELEETLYITESNGATVQNQLQDADFETYDDLFNGAQYLTRDNWTGTFPTDYSGSVTIPEGSEMWVRLQNEYYDKAAANAAYDGTPAAEQTFGADNGATMVDIIGVTDYDDERYQDVLDAIPFETMVNYTAGNSQSPITEIVFPALSASDSCVGMVSSIGSQKSSATNYDGVDAVSTSDPNYGASTASYVGEPVVASTFSHRLATAMGTQIGNEALWIGVYWWYAPGLNLHRTPYNCRNIEYYSEDSALTGYMASDVISAAQAKGVVCTPKHLAFNDQETNRDGLAVFLNEQAARENELRGFGMAVRDGGTKSMMTAFNRVGFTFCSAHTGLMTGIVRGEWGYKGFITTDSTKSGYYFRATEIIAAGTDYILAGGNYADPDGRTFLWTDYTADQILEDDFLTNQVRESIHHMLWAFADSAVFNGITSDSSASTSMPWWEAMLISIIVVSAVLTAACGSMYAVGLVRGRKNGGDDSNNDGNGVADSEEV